MASTTASNESEKNQSTSMREVIEQPPQISETSMNIVSSILNQYAVGQKKTKKGNVGSMKGYLSRRKIGELLHYMMQHLVIQEPEDPVNFLQQLMDKCMMFRAGILCDAPLTFEDRHILSIYNSFDPLETGSISTKQYHVGVQTLGLKKDQYNMKPKLEEDGSVAKQTFLTNAKMALVERFMDMVLLPPPLSDGEPSSIETFFH